MNVFSGAAHFVVAVDLSVALLVNAVNALTGIGYIASTALVTSTIIVGVALAIRHYDRRWERQLAQAKNQ